MSTTMHPFTPEEIMAFVDGELPADRVQSVAAHVDQCAKCRELIGSFRYTSHSLSSWTVPGAPSNVLFENRLAASKFKAQSNREFSVGFNFRTLFSRRWFLAIASACVVVLLLWIASAPLQMSRPMKEEQSAEGPGEGRGSLGKLTPIVPAASPNARSGVRADKVGNGINFTNFDKSKAPPPPPPPPGQPQVPLKITTTFGTETAEPMIARNVALSIVVKDFDAARMSLDAILARHKGYAANLDVATPQGAGRTIQASLRIPASQLVAAVAELKALGRVENETQGGEEVTQQHADLVARLKNSRETEQRLQDVLRTRTGKVKDVLEVEEEIARVRGEIEEMEAEQQTLKHRVNFATIDLKLAEEYKAQLSSPAPSVGIQLRNATVNGFRNAFESLLGILLFLAESGPTLLLWLLILLFPARLIWKRYRRSLAMASSSEV